VVVQAAEEGRQIMPTLDLRDQEVSALPYKDLLEEMDGTHTLLHMQQEVVVELERQVRMQYLRAKATAELEYLLQ
jgi:hypothetical protein